MNKSSLINLISILLVIIISILAIISCKKEKVIVQGYFHSMHFVRQGGGQIDFHLYPTGNPDMLKTKVIRYNNRDTSVEFIMGNSEKSASAFSSYQKAMNNEMQINGNFQQSTLETGTWAYLYFVYDTTETEVTNTSLRDTLLKFEQMVRNKLEQ